MLKGEAIVGRAQRVHTPWPRLVEELEGQGVCFINSGGNHALAITAGGELWARPSSRIKRVLFFAARSHFKAPQGDARLRRLYRGCKRGSESWGYSLPSSTSERMHWSDSSRMSKSLYLCILALVDGIKQCQNWYV